MKAYVQQPASIWTDPSRWSTPCEMLVEYCRARPSWTMPLAEAHARCQELNAAHVCSMQSGHDCRFGVEEVAAGQFAVCCVFHPNFVTSDWGYAANASAKPA